MMGLKINVPLRGKTKDAMMRLLFPHISESIFLDYLAGISTAFSFSLFQVVQAIF